MTENKPTVEEGLPIATQESTNGVQYEISDEYQKALRQYFGTKPFIDAAPVIQAVAKKVVTEQEANLIVGMLGQYPYDEVEPFFTEMKKGIVPIKKDQPAE